MLFALTTSSFPTSSVCEKILEANSTQLKIILNFFSVILHISTNTKFVLSPVTNQTYFSIIDLF